MRQRAGAGNDTLTYTGGSLARTVSLTSTGTIDGFSGTASGLAGFLNINTLMGGSAIDILNGLNSASTRTITGATTVTYTSGNSMAVSNFETWRVAPQPIR